MPSAASPLSLRSCCNGCYPAVALRPTFPEFRFKIVRLYRVDPPEELAGRGWIENLPQPFPPVEVTSYLAMSQGLTSQLWGSKTHALGLSSPQGPWEAWWVGPYHCRGYHHWAYHSSSQDREDVPFDEATVTERALPWYTANDYSVLNLTMPSTILRRAIQEVPMLQSTTVSSVG